MLISTAASFAAILFIRYYDSAIPDFIGYVNTWLLCSMIASAIAILITNTYRILFQYASFKAISSILLCALIKDVLLTVPILLDIKYVVEDSFLLVLCDFSMTLIALILLKLVALIYNDDGERKHKEEEEEEEEARSVNCLNIAVFGVSPKSIAAITRYQKSPKYNIKAVVTRDQSLNGKIVMDYPVIACPEDISDFYIKDVEAVLFPNFEEWQSESDKLVKQLDEKGICVMTLPRAESTNYPGLELKEIKHILESNFVPDHMSGIGRSSKRLFDLFLSMILIVVFSIPILVIYLILRFTDGKPVLFKQERIGRFGRPFNILKFRTMRLDAEKFGPALYSGDDDPRLTKVGKFLRQHHLDELPQLFNVFMGQMSFVGYRPERKVYIDKIVEKDPRYAYLYQIRPGVTSYATLRNGYTDTMEKMLRRLNLDLYYLNHRSFFFDMKVLWDTFLSIAIGKKF